MASIHDLTSGSRAKGSLADSGAWFQIELLAALAATAAAGLLLAAASGAATPVLLAVAAGAAILIAPRGPVRLLATVLLASSVACGVAALPVLDDDAVCGSDLLFLPGLVAMFLAPVTLLGAIGRAVCHHPDGRTVRLLVGSGLIALSVAVAMSVAAVASIWCGDGG